MKKCIPLLLVVCLVGCTAAPASSSANGTSQAGVPSSGVAIDLPCDPLLAKLLTTPETAELGRAYIDTQENALRYQSLETVRVTRDLLQQICGAVIAGEPERLETPFGSTTAPLDNMMVQFRYDDDQYVMLDLALRPEEQPDGTKLWMQLGEETAEYALDASVFTDIKAMVDAATFPKELALEGEYTVFRPTAVDVNQIYDGLYLMDVLEANGNMLYLWQKDGGFLLEQADATARKTQTVFEKTFPGNFRSLPVQLEPADYEGFDYRLVGNGSVTYRSSKDPTATQTYEVSVAPEDTRRLSYDIHPQTGRIAYSSDEGVYIQLPGQAPALVLSNSDAPEPPSQGMPSRDAQFDSFYTSVHFMAGGKQLVVSLIFPGSQSGLAGLAIIDVDTGDVTQFADIFSAMVAEIRYPNDNTVAAVATGQVTMIDAATKKVSTMPFDNMSLTRDFQTAVRFQPQRGESGTFAGEVEVFPADDPEATRNILSVTGENAELHAVTEHYAVLVCRDSKDAYVALVPIPGR